MILFFFLNKISKPTCTPQAFGIDLFRNLLGISPLRPQKHGKPKMKEKSQNPEIRDRLKKFRFNQNELDQIEVILKMKGGQSLTDFFRNAIHSEIKRSSFYVPTLKEQQSNLVLRPKHIKKTKLEIIKQYQKIDPTLLLELSRIGNNVNQIARALNVIKETSGTKFDFLQCQYILKSIQTELHEFLPSLPKIKRSDQAVERRKAQLEKKLESLSIEESEDAY